MTRSKRMVERLNDRIPPPPPRPTIWCKLEELRPDELSRFEAFLRSWTPNGPASMLKDIPTAIGRHAGAWIDRAVCGLSGIVKVLTEDRLGSFR